MKHRVDLLDVELPVDGPSIDLIALDEALSRLADSRPKHAELVKLRFFAGLTGEQTARAMDLSVNTADRYWAYARSWLRVEMEKGHEPPVV